MGKQGICRLVPAKILRIHRMMKADPLRIWICKDFGINPKTGKQYMTTLVGLGLIEQVPVIYRFGNRLKATRNIMGWRIKQ